MVTKKIPTTINDFDELKPVDQFKSYQEMFKLTRALTDEQREELHANYEIQGTPLEPYVVFQGIKKKTYDSNAFV